MDQEKINRARQVTGEAYNGGGANIPSIKFFSRGSQYGDKGNFYLLDTEGQEIKSTPLGESIGVVVLKARKRMHNGEMEGKKKMVSEFDTNTPNTIVQFKIGDPPVTTTMTLGQVKKDNPDMKYVEIWYVYHAGKVCRLKIPGGSLGNLFKYYQSIPYNDSIMAHKTILGGDEEVQHPAGAYRAITFKDGGPNDHFDKHLDTVQSLGIATPVAALPNGQSVIENNDDTGGPGPLPQTQKDTSNDLPISTNEPEINVEDIPF